MSYSLHLVYGGRQTGRTTLVGRRLAGIQPEPGHTPALMFVANYAACDTTDSLLKAQHLTEIREVKTCPGGTADLELRGRRPVAIGWDWEGTWPPRYVIEEARILQCPLFVTVLAHGPAHEVELR